MESSERTIPNLYKIFKGTVAGGLIINVIFTPCDVVKNYWYFNDAITKCRTQMSTVDVVKHIYRSSGLSSFWLGIHWSTPLTIFGHSIFLFTYDSIKNDMPPPLASLASRLVTLLFSQPLDCMRTHSQATLNASERDSFFGIVKKYGFGSLYKGSYTTLIRDIPFSIIHWPINEFIYKKISSLEIYKKRKMNHFESITYPFLTGAFSSLIATIVSQPFDIIKTNLQTTGVDFEEAKSHRTPSGKINMLTELKRIKSNYGIRGLFIGVAPRVMKVVPGSAIMSATYHFFN